MNRELGMIDLFAGTGAFSIAFQATGHVQVRFGNDMIEPARIIHEHNFEHPLTVGDINDIPIQDIPPHDILTGGFPCQPFSIAGLQEGFADKRSNAFWKILDILDHHAPKCIVLENVKTLVSHDKGRTFTVIRDQLEQRGYHLRTKVLNTARITGIPHHRERIYIVGLKSKRVFDAFHLDFPDIPKRPLTEFWEDTPVPHKYYYTPGTNAWTLIQPAVVNENTVYQYRRVYVRENKSGECPTLTANMGTGGHNVPLIRDAVGIRKLTPRECFRMQGFPDTFCLDGLSDSKLYSLAGNAVSVPIVQKIAERLIPLLIQADADADADADAERMSEREP